VGSPYRWFEGGDIEKANNVQIIITSPGYTPSMSEFDFPEDECDSDLYVVESWRIMLEKE
jgi:hypothetical protein